MSSKPEGICYLVGAGPGDPGLITLRGRECIEHAEVIIYDSLCNPEILKWATADAEIIYAGKKPREHSMPQEEINALLVEKTKAGKAVVRLKGGDPFLFGRGGEEAEALVDAGLRFEVVPGVSSAIAGPAYAGIPVTHRGYSSQLTIFTGHEDPAKSESGVDYAILARQPGTKVMLMGMERLEQIVSTLLKEGADPQMPVALVRCATTGAQETLRGVLRTICDIMRERDFTAPAIAVFGGVVRMRDRLNWFETRPLFGRKIVVTRSRKQASTLASRLRNLGADVIELPTIRIEPPRDLLEFGQLVQEAHQYDWIVFTSVNGVTAFFEMFFKLYDDAREIGPARIAAIGPETAQRVKDYHLKVDLHPAEFVVEGLIREFQKHGSLENQRILIPRAEVTREVLATELTAMGAIVDEAIAYRTVPEDSDVSGGISRFRQEGADLIVFTSSSTAQNFMALNLPFPQHLKMGSIGPITSKTMRELGLKVDIEARQHDIPGLVKAICRFYLGDRSPTGGLQS
jgi:uroporphyrinogen III methyltransferase / synthase